MYIISNDKRKIWGCALEEVQRGGCESVDWGKEWEIITTKLTI